MAFWTANSPQLQWRCHNDHCCRIYRPGICPYVCVYVCCTSPFSWVTGIHTYVYGKLYVSLSTKQSVYHPFLLFTFAAPKMGSGALIMMSLDLHNLLDLCIVQCHGLMMQWPVYIRCHWLVYLITLTAVINFIGGINSLCRTHLHLNCTVFSVFRLQLLNLRLQL